MSVQQHSEIRKSPNDSNGFSITPVKEQKFRDWQGGKLAAAGKGDRRDDVLLSRPTMEMGNDHQIGYERKIHQPPENSVTISGKNLYERLRSHNRDTWWQYRVDSSIAKGADKDFKIYLIKAFGEELGLNPLLRQRAFRKYMKMDIPKATGRTQTNAFLVCVIVANEEARTFGGDKVYHPQRSAENNDKRFQKLADDLCRNFSEVTTESLTKIYNKYTQGSPPTRHPSEWKQVVKRHSIMSQNPSYASEDINPERDQS